MMKVPTYRLCFNQAPHCKDWWSVERKGLFGWSTVKDYRCVIHPGFIPNRCFESKAEAEAWIVEAKRPRVHQCGPAQ